jgi:hypothetical protein
VFSPFKKRNDKFKFYEVISNTAETKKCKIHYGDLSISTYADCETSESGQGIIKEINSLKTK